MRREQSMSRRSSKSISSRQRPSYRRYDSKSLEEEDIEYDDNNHNSQDNKIRHNIFKEANHLRLSDDVRFTKNNRTELELELTNRAPCQDLDTISL